MSKLEISGTIITALIGIAYPLMLQAIERVDNKYQSQSLTSLLIASKWIVCFRVWLLVNVVLLIAAGCSEELGKLTNYPRIPLILTWTVYVSMFILICVFFKSCSLILTFYNTDRLIEWFAEIGKYWEWTFRKIHTCKRLKETNTFRIRLQRLAAKRVLASVSSQLMEGWTGLMGSLFQINEGNLIIRNYQFLTARLALIRELSDATPVSYPDSMNKAVADINSIICKSNERAFSFTCSNDLLICFAGSMDGKENSEQTRNIIWKCLTEQIYRHREDLLSSYWEYAVQRSSLFLHKEENQSYYKRYIEFHIALGAHLLYEGRDQLLSEMLFRSQTYPPEYTLIPSNFSDVFEWFLVASRSFYADNMYFETQYPFLNDPDAFGSGIIRRYLKKYLAILFLRLKYVPTIFINENTTEFNRDYEETPSGIKLYIDACEALKKEVDEWQTQKVRCEKLLEKHPFEGEMTDMLSILDEYKEFLLGQAQKIKETQTYSADIISSYQHTIAEQLDSRIGDYQLFLDSPTSIPSPESDSRNLPNNVSIKGIYPSSYFKEGQVIPVCGFDTALAQQIYMEMQHHIATTFYIQKRWKSVYMDDVLKALDKLNPKADRHIILSFGYDGYFSSRLDADKSGNKYKYKGVPLYLFPGSPVFDTFVIIIDKEKVPKIELKEPDKDTKKLFNYKKISTLYPLYWGLTDLKNKSDLKEKLMEKKQIESSSINDKSYLSVYLIYKLFIPENCVLDGFKLVGSYSSTLNEVDKLTELEDDEHSFK